MSAQVPTYKQRIKYIAIVFVNIILILTLFDCTMRIYNKLNYYYYYNPEKKVNKSNKFQLNKPKDFKAKTYFKDPDLKRNFKESLEASQRIKNITKSKEINRETLDKLSKDNKNRFLLICGRAGSGKSYTTKALFGELPDNYRILTVSSSSFLDPYNGQDQKNLTEAFEYVKKNRDFDVIIYFDEADLVCEEEGIESQSPPLVNQFLLLAGSDTTIARTSFVCVLISNIDYNNLSERIFRRLKIFNIQPLKREHVAILKKKAAKTYPIFKDLGDYEDIFLDVFENQTLQKPVDFIKNHKDNSLNEIKGNLDVLLEAKKQYLAEENINNNNTAAGTDNEGNGEGDNGERTENNGVNNPFPGSFTYSNISIDELKRLADLHGYDLVIKSGVGSKVASESELEKQTP